MGKQKIQAILKKVYIPLIMSGIMLDCWTVGLWDRGTGTVGQLDCQTNSSTIPRSHNPTIPRSHNPTIPQSQPPKSLLARGLNAQ
ncbi:MAG TPA: hypothetical protein DIW47_00055 [Bacteroidetes bacterium]|nr:hypothetical protein [Bacteroidota bacterium]